MYAGKTLFAQMMDFLPWTTFHRIVQRYREDFRAGVLTCAEQFRVMAFAQPTYRESLRDIETCLCAQRTSPITWAFGSLCSERRSRMPTRLATGASMTSSRSG